MANRSLSPSMDQSLSSRTAITDLNEDSLACCAGFLDLQDICNVAMSCKYLRQLAYSDSIWQYLFRERWRHGLASHSLLASGGAREAYLARFTAMQQFRFEDPLIADMRTQAKPYGPIIFNGDVILASQGSSIHMMKFANFFCRTDSHIILNDHNARITCMRLFPLSETSLFRSKRQIAENFLVTASSDHSIRLWWKNSCQRCFRGHNGPVTTLCNKFLGDGSGKVLASGGEDGTVRLWSLSSSGKGGKSALKATLYGHEKPIKFMSVAGHKSSLLVSVAGDSKVRVWDATASSTIRSSCCVGSISLPGSPINIKCHESLLYVASGSSVVGIDLRTMQKVLNVASQSHQPLLYSFDTIPSKSLICTGGNGSAMLWDTRKCQDAMKAEPIVELEGHRGPVSYLHVDPYKIVTGGPDDIFVNVWEVDSGGTQVNSLNCWFTENTNNSTTLSSFAVNGCRIVTACYGEEAGLLRCRDFTNASCPIIRNDELLSKFWDPQCYSDGDSSGL